MSSHYERPAYCPACNVSCTLRELASQERENTCPQCGKVFIDATEPFHGNFHGLFYESADPGSPPMAMFRDEDDLKKYLAYLEKDTDEDAQATARQVVELRCSVYGIYNNTTDDDPFADTFQPFIPDELPADVIDTREPVVDFSQQPPDGENPMLRLKVVERFRLAGDVPAYFCARTGRWYVFFLLSGDPDYVSVNDGGTSFVHVYLAGMVACLRTNEAVDFLAWDAFVSRGGKVKLPKDAETPDDDAKQA